MISLNLKPTERFIDRALYDKYVQKALKGFDVLMNGGGLGNDFLGWVTLPSTVSESVMNRCLSIRDKWKSMGVDTTVIIGIGGSYLGTKCALSALQPSFGRAENNSPEMLFAGNNISEDYLYELSEYLKDKNFTLIVISKSGTTTEPAVAFRILRKFLKDKFGDETAKERIVAITDSSKGALKKEADREGYETFAIPDNVGGRYSVLTPVGLLPIAIAGFDIRLMLNGAHEMQKQCAIKDKTNIALRYAAMRNALYDMGKKIEILVNFNPKLSYFGEWWKQLYGESEGKDKKGIFPTSVNFTTDLHSMGQYIQDGERIIFETSVLVREANNRLVINKEDDDSDGLNYIAGKRVEEVNKMAQIGTMIAHVDGGVPNIVFEIEKIDEFCLGQLFYLFEFACGISGYMLGINPFDQPGVEAYKKNMFALLGKSGYEKETDKLKNAYDSD